VLFKPKQRDHDKEVFQVNASTRSKRIRQRPKTDRIVRHQDQPMLWPNDGAYRPVFRNRQVRLAVQERGNVTAYGGLSLAHDLAMRLALDKTINDHLYLLKIKLPYFESDHLLTHVYNLFAGGTCIEDIANLQHSEAIRSLLGACRIPDPTTAGDFLRRFSSRHLEDFQNVIDEAREKVWRQLPRSRRTVATIDMDSTVKEVFGDCKAGADFSYNGKWSYHPLLFTLAETYEPLRTINRSGNAASADGAAAALHEVLPMVKRHFDTIFVRGDSKFYRRELIAECETHHALFAFVMDGYAVLHETAEGLPPSAWKPFREGLVRSGAAVAGKRRLRQKRKRTRDKIVRQRGYRNLRTIDQHVAEFPYRIPRHEKDADYGLTGRSFRVIVKRQTVQTSEGQDLLFTEYRYRFVITNIPAGQMTAAQVLQFAHRRGDQENAIEQLKNGIAALRMPTGELRANGAFLLAGQLAWCLRTWLSLLALPTETIRWEWKAFRQAFVYVGAKITRIARQVLAYLTGSHRFVNHLVIASQRLHSFVFR
jgi:hypothetical protein